MPPARPGRPGFAEPPAGIPTMPDTSPTSRRSRRSAPSSPNGARVLADQAAAQSKLRGRHCPRSGVARTGRGGAGASWRHSPRAWRPRVSCCRATWPGPAEFMAAIPAEQTVSFGRAMQRRPNRCWPRSRNSFRPAEVDQLWRACPGERRGATAANRQTGRGSGTGHTTSGCRRPATTSASPRRSMPSRPISTGE